MTLTDAPSATATTRSAVREVRVRVPATSANLGPGFDSFGIAIGRYDDLSACLLDGEVRVSVTGLCADGVPRDASHLVVRSAQRVFDELGLGPIGIDLTCVNGIPHGGGQGSSAAATVGGMLLARDLVPEGVQLDTLDILRLATEMEGHPDNVAPALFGGLTVSYVRSDGSIGSIRHEVHPSIRLIVFSAGSHSSTRVTRQMLPATISHADAAANSAATAVLLHAMTDDPAYLMDGTVDRLHQAYRARAMPESAALMLRLRTSGVPAVISGAGASVLALVTEPLDLSVWTDTGFEAAEFAVDQHGAVSTVVDVSD